MQRIGANRTKRIVIEALFIVLLIALIIVDQITKAYFSSTLKNGQDIIVIEDFFYFTYVINTGAAWSFLSGVSWAQIFFKILTSIALIGFITFYAYAVKKGYKWLKVSLIFVIGGTIGNFIDRLFINGVIDFIGFYFWDYAFPIFNLADSFLVVGIIMLLIYFLFMDENAVFKRKDAKNEHSDN